jgi:hypothetical protein
MKVAFILFFLILFCQSYAQLWQVEIGINPLAPLDVGSRHHELNQSDNIYAEIRAFRSITSNWSVGIFAGFENKRKLSFYQLTQPQPGDETNWIPQPK